ncbi:M20/M25/M40 family metallo-hydrolase [Paenibacillus albidus]|uniref:M20 family metallopeptidase n=1 Tax=Paenibacillus albidus TaxID=2041023 RepID=UPI001BE6A5C3|nr:M20/M25/M40 family metallo-hydrolase [Paenibacillus albidus]MBT2287746.1 M20/M25/M40 family metallo-hydrolase [Paenibacillus albidus]
MLASELIAFQNTSAERINCCADYCADWLRQRGLAVRCYEHGGLKSLVAELGTGDPVVVLNGHLDVVPGQPEEFIPYVDDGRLFGRGSYDMLGSVASMMVLMSELVTQPPACRVVLKLVPDEESGGELGTGYLVRQWGLVGDVAICGEPTNLNIAVQAKGILQLTIDVPGLAAHGSRPWLGKNAILEALRHFQTIASLEFFQESTPFFPQPSLNLAKIQAGTVFNQVPDLCRLSIDIRYLPGQDPAVILAAIREAVPQGEVNVHFEGSPVNTQTTDRLIKKLRYHAGSRFFGQDGSADTRFYAERGIPAVEFGPSGANHHGPGEYVLIDSMLRYKEILNEFITYIREEER